MSHHVLGQYHSASERPAGRILGRERGSKDNDTQKIIVEAAKKLFRQIGFHKTTVADIARELRMSPANVYRFFAVKAEINEAVCTDLLGRIEADAEKVIESRSTAAQKIRILIESIKKAYYKQYLYDRKLHELFDVAAAEHWEIMRRHSERMIALLEQIIASGMASGEFPPGDAALAARLIDTACIRYNHPQISLGVETEPSLEQMIGFCLAALTKQPLWSRAG